MQLVKKLGFATASAVIGFTVVAASSAAQAVQLFDFQYSFPNYEANGIAISAKGTLTTTDLDPIAKKLGFSRIKPENKQHVVLETPMEEPAWNLLAANLPDNLKTRFVYSPGKVTVRGLGVFKADQQLQNLSDAFGRMQGAIPEAAVV